MCFVGITERCYCYGGLLLSQQDGLNPTSTSILNESPRALSHFSFLFSLNEKDILLFKSSDVLILMQF